MNAENSSSSNTLDPVLFWGCFIALVTCAFGFIVRTQVIGDWQTELNLSNTQVGELSGVGFWPFAFSIIIFSLFIDKVGYKPVAIFGLICHALSTVILITAKSYEMLYLGTFIFALSNGTVEAYINPVVAAAKSKEKGKWLSILHAGWPGGSALAGIIAIMMSDVSWQTRVAITFIPTIIYGIMLFPKKFPISERVAAGVSHKEMLRDFGGIGFFIATYLVALQVLNGIFQMDNAFLWSLLPAILVGVAMTAVLGGAGHPVGILLMIIMLPLATTELGIDSWVTPLMGPAMQDLGIENAGWLLVYTMVIMTVLRFMAGPILVLFKDNPFNLLAFSSALAIVGLFALSSATGMMILVAATLYGVGKTFFWPMMLAAGNEQCPKGGAMTLNSIGGVGMLGLSVGMVFLGAIQDDKISADLGVYDEANQSNLIENYTIEKEGLFGTYRSIDQEKLNSANEADKKTIDDVTAQAKKSALKTSTVFPVIMLISYLIFIFYYKASGGYKPIELNTVDISNK